MYPGINLRRKYMCLRTKVPKISIAPKSTHALGHQPEREGWRKAITREEGLASKKKRGEKREEEGKTWRRISICSWADRVLLHRRQAPCKSSCNACKSPPSDLRRCLTCFCSVKSPSTCKISVKRLEPLSPFLSSLLILLIMPTEK